VIDLLLVFLFPENIFDDAGKGKDGNVMEKHLIAPASFFYQFPDKVERLVPRDPVPDGQHSLKLSG
jgi:hypothetical protein